jgi:hypothetical protein
LSFRFGVAHWRSSHSAQPGLPHSGAQGCRAHGRSPLKIAGCDPFRALVAVSASDCREIDFVLPSVMAWSPPNWQSPAGEWMRSFAIITTTPNELCAEIHNRMPVILKPEAWPAWLGEKPAEVPQLKALLAPYPSEDMICWPVSARVGNVRNNDSAGEAEMRGAVGGGNPADPETVALIRRLEEALLVPEVRKSAAQIAALLADEFVEIGSSGRIYGKDQIIGQLLQESGEVSPRTASDFTARELADGLILVVFQHRRRTPV